MDVIQVFGTDYRLLHVFGTGAEKRPFSAPGGLAIEPGTNRLYVAEMLANRVSAFQLR
jgi:DNA-binding beta-propeller fold protein YncE